MSTTQQEMIKDDGVRSYFGKHAARYSDSTQSWDSIKQKEKQAIFTLLDAQLKDIILDAGCGDGYYLSELVNQGIDAQGVDFSPEMVEAAKARGLNVEVMNLAEDVRFNRRFNKILCPGVLEFVKNPGLVICNLSQQLEKGGAITLLLPRVTPLAWVYRLYHLTLGCRRWIRLFDVKTVEGYAKENGLKIDEMIKVTSLSFAVRLKKC